MVCKTNEHSHAEEHVGPFRFTDPITTIENKGGLQRTNLPLQRDSESDASETEETICEMVSQSTQTNTSAPNGTLHLSAPPSQAKTKETKVMNLPESEAKAVKFGQDEATSQKKETKDPVDTETSPVAHGTPGETTSGGSSGPSLDSFNLSPESSLGAGNSLDGTNINNELTSESVQQIVIDGENLLEAGEPGEDLHVT